MANIAKMNVELTATSKKFSDALKRSSAQVTSFKSTVQGAFSSLAGNLGANTITAMFSSITSSAMQAGRQVRQFISDAMTSIDDTGKLAAELGLSSSALVQWQHAAGLSGVEAEELSNMFRKFSRNIGEAAQGSGSAVGALQMLGLSANQLRAVGLDEAMMLVAERVSAIPDPFIRASLAADIFGKTGQKLSALLMSGTDGINAMRADAERLGITFSDIDFRNVEMANDAIERLYAAFRGVWNQVAIGLSPAIKILTDQITSMFTGTNSLASVVRTTMQELAANMPNLLGYLADMVVSGVDFALTIQQWVSGLRDFASVVKPITDAITFNPIRDAIGKWIGDNNAALKGPMSVQDFRQQQDSPLMRLRESALKMREPAEWKRILDDNQSAAVKAAATATAQSSGVFDLPPDPADLAKKKKLEDKIQSDINKRLMERRKKTSDITSVTDDLQTAALTVDDTFSSIADSAERFEKSMSGAASDSKYLGRDLSPISVMTGGVSQQIASVAATGTSGTRSTGAQEVYDPQLKITNDLLSRMVGGGLAAVAV